MHDLKALRSIFLLVALFAVVIAALALLVSSGYTEHVTPSAETTSEQLVKALGAHRYEAALDQLSGEPRQRVTSDDLRELTRRIEESHGGIGQAHGDGEESSGETATAHVRVQLVDGREQEITFPLVRENAIWKVSSLDPLERLAQ